jgi:hypothetical protein
MELTMRPGAELFDQTIYYNPGNHDHHVWETAREPQYVEIYLAHTTWSVALDAPWHMTNIFLGEHDPVPCYLLNRLLDRFEPKYDVGKQPQFLVVYPNCGVRSADKQKCVIFSHGHYVESIYRLMTTFRTMLFPDRTEPELIWNLEAENFVWVHFFWSTMGRSGDAGTDVELVYDKLQTDAQIMKLVSNLTAGITEQHGLPWVPQTVEHMILTEVLNVMLDGVASREVKQTDTCLSADAESGLRDFLQKHLLKQIQTDNAGAVPNEVTFIFGHTHKPFEAARPYAGYANGVNVLHNGGWVVDSMTPAQLQCGAVVLVDEELNTDSVRIYNEAAGDAQPHPAPHVSDVIMNPLVQQLQTLISGSTVPRSAMTQAVFSEIPRQRINLNAKIQAQD